MLNVVENLLWKRLILPKYENNEKNLKKKKMNNALFSIFVMLKPPCVGCVCQMKVVTGIGGLKNLLKKMNKSQNLENEKNLIKF